MRMGLMAAVAGAVVGVAGGLAMGGENAALSYYRAWALMGDTPQKLIETGKDEIKLTPQAPGQLARLDDSIQILIRAAETGVADWGVDYEDGPNTLLPHLGSLRHSARVMAAAALQHGEHGALDQASECLATLHRMGVDSASGDHLISSLVGIAIGNLGVELTNQMIDDGMIDGAGARVVLEAIRSDGRSDRYRMRDAIVGEWRMMSEYIVKHAPEQDAGAWLLDDALLTDDSGPSKTIREMDRSALVRELGGLAEYHSDLLSAWDAQSMEKLERAEARVQSGSYGALTEIMGATLLRTFSSDEQSREQLDELIERLEGIAD